MRSGKVQRGVLWLVSFYSYHPLAAFGWPFDKYTQVSEYSSSENEIKSAWSRIRAGLGEIPILQSENRLLEEANEPEAPEEQVNGHGHGKPTKTRLAADGTYQVIPQRNISCGLSTQTIFVLTAITDRKCSYREARNCKGCTKAALKTA